MFQRLLARSPGLGGEKTPRRKTSVRDEPRYHLNMATNASCSTKWSSLLIQQVSLHAQSKPASRTILQNICSLSWVGELLRSYTAMRMTCWNSGSFASHVCDSIAYRKNCRTSCLMRLRSMRVVIEDTSSLKTGSDSNADACSVFSKRRPVVVSMSTRSTRRIIR